MTFVNPLVGSAPPPTGPVTFMLPNSNLPIGGSSGLPAPGTLGARLLGMSAPANNTYGLTNPAPGTLGSRLAGTTSTVGGRIPTSNVASRIAGSVAPASTTSSAPTFARQLGRNVAARNLNTFGGAARFAGRASLAGLASGLAAGVVGNQISGGAEDTPGFGRADVGQFISGAGVGAGVGATAGSIVPGIGTGIGALIGGGIGGVANALGLFGGGGEGEGVADIYADPESSLNTFTKAATTGFGELPERTRNAVTSLVEANLSLATTPEERQQIVMGGVQELMAAEQQEAANAQQVANSLAYQAQAANILQPFKEQNQATADLAKQMFGNTRDTLPENLQPLADYQALAAQQGADAMTQHLYTTALAQPRVDAMVAQQQQIQSLAAQIVQQAQAGVMGGGGGMGGGGAGEFEQTMASLGL